MKKDKNGICSVADVHAVNWGNDDDDNGDGFGDHNGDDARKEDGDDDDDNDEDNGFQFPVKDL